MINESLKNKKEKKEERSGTNKDTGT